MGKSKKKISSGPPGQGGHVDQLQKLENTQMKPCRQTKQNPAQDALESQSVNIMAPEVKRPKPRPKPVGLKSKTPPISFQQQNISPVNDLPTFHLCSPHSQFGFIPPTDEDADADEENEDEDGRDDGLGAHSPFQGTDVSQMRKQKQTHTPSLSTYPSDICSSPRVPDGDICPPPQSPNTLQAKAQKPTCTITLDDVNSQHPLVLNKSHVKKFKKNTRPITPSADKDSYQRHCPIVSSPETSDSNIPSPPCHTPKPVSSSTALDTVHNVLQEHHEKNWCPCTPDLRTLQKLGQRAIEELSNGEEDEAPSQPHKRSHPSKGYQTIAFYLPAWKDVLEAAKQKSHLGVVMGGATTTHKAFIEKTSIEYLMETLEDFAANNIGVNAGFWDEHKHDMMIILWDDCATMQSEMKKVACPIATTKYDILPTDIHDEDEYEEHVHSQVKDLMDDSNFLHNGVDKQGRTNNLANDALREFCSTFFYKSEHVLAKSFPDEFAEAVPEGTVALAATALAAAINEYKTGIYKPTKFVSELYQPIYNRVLQLYEDVKIDPYHSKKCRAVRKKWVHAANVLTHDQSNRRNQWGLKLKLD
ncbi:uncharacterized protein BJ212DRAFT_1305589 [Suillus subaureus]|uniref:DUF6532 domain-containing protein n=1 Tax=Suillus subaureus TaxID=48587 RepID=A0A9P7DNJ6_9AGAM|nr:uncharacterized protein BJ212DRAFT_1305589 [Suillus subaureus]KAG1799137.1 hypothetical protein BJ212DRAFT_1305589 [Suillus subaureus]